MSHTNNKLNRFSIRKYSVGVASVIIGAYFLAQQQAVSADQVAASTTSDTPTELVTEATPVVTTAPVSTSETTSNDTLTPEGTKSEQVKEVSPEAPTPVNEVATADKTSATEKVESTESDVTANAESKENKEVDPTNPQGLKTVGYAAANVDQPSFDTTRRRAPKNYRPVPKEFETTATGEGHVALFATGNGSIARGDDYPAQWKNTQQDAVVDSWGLWNRECTSFVAYRLSSVNGYELPRAYGNATSWGTHARSQGIRVDNTPGLGSVAWNSFGHVAWVSNVLGNSVEIEEYNYGYTGAYHRRVIPVSSVTGFIHFKDIAGGSSYTPANPISTNTENQGTPASGTYRFTGRASIKSEPSISSPELAYYDAGQTVNYDRTLEADGHEWISYLSFAGNRRYIAIRELAKPVTTSVSDKPTGIITITNNNSIIGSFDIIVSNVWDPNGVQKVSLPTWSEVDGQDDIIWYTATRQSDGTYRQHVEASEHKNSTGTYNVHMYYVENSGKLGWGGGTTTNVQMSNPMPNIPSSGVYHFTGHAGIKSEPRMSSPELAYYDAGNTVNYDKVLSSDGHAWISYISYSGNRRYIAIN